MIETVLVLPIIMLVLSLLFLFGLNFMRLTQATEASRYAAWRAVEHAPGPQTGSDLNLAFFRDEASDVSIDIGNGYPDDDREVLIDAIEQFDDSDALDYARDWLDDFPTGRVASVSVTHDTDIPLWQQFNGTITQRETRIDNEWKYINRVLNPVAGNSGPTWYNDGTQAWVGGSPPCLGQTTVLRDVFYESFDDVMEPIANGGNPQAATIRRYYLWLPGYRGPHAGIQN